MFKITLMSSLEKIYHFIDNRLVLQMAEKKLRQKGTLAKFWIKDVKQNIDDTIFYVEKESNRATLMIIPTEKVGNKVKPHPCGMTLRERYPNEFDLYIDLAQQAVEKGILSSKHLRITPKKLALIIAGIVLLLSAVAFFPVFVVVSIIIIILYPIIYLKSRRHFRHQQEIIATIVSLFEGEFQTKNKVDTKDWVNFWGRVKSGVKEAITPF